MSIVRPKVLLYLNKKGVDWASPTTLVAILLALLLGLALLYYIWQLRGRLGL